MDFQLWLGQVAFQEIAVLDNFFSKIQTIINEDSKSKINKRNSKTILQTGSLFGDDLHPSMQHVPKSGAICHTPLSSFHKEITTIKNFAASGPDQFAQVLMFSPLSANVGFSKHWDNFPVLMAILKTRFPNKVKKEELQRTIDGFSDKFYALPGTIAGWKYETITHVWNNREQLYSKLRSANAKGDEAELLAELVKIPGVAPVKAGFIAQLIFGRSGCLDTHNLQLYSKVWGGELSDELNPERWKSTDGMDGIKRYTATLEKLRKKGIGTPELWDVWVDFVGHMSRMISSGGTSAFADLEPALNPNDPKYQDLKTQLNKVRITSAGKKTSAVVPVSTITGDLAGGGAGATHTIAAKDYDDSLRTMDKLTRTGQGPNWAKAVERKLNPATGLPIEKGVGNKPAMLHYFGNTVKDNEVDYDKIRDIINQRYQTGGKKLAKARADDAQGGLF